MKNIKMNINDLHSQRLRFCYGDITINILNQTDKFRVVVLKDKKEVIRTVAITIFSDKQYSPELEKINSQIKSGELIGESIIKEGFEVIKKKYHEFQIWADKFPFFEKAQLLRCHIYDLFIRKKDKEEFYGEICEIYCPNLNDVESWNSLNNPSKEIFKNIIRILKYAKIENFKITINI